MANPKTANNTGAEEARKVGRPRKIETPDDMWLLWEEYKAECDNNKKIETTFSPRSEIYITENIPSPIIYDITGFCSFIGISRTSFYDTYTRNNEEEFASVVTRMRDECEVDALRKFEMQYAPSQLAGLRLSKYGYSTNVESKVEVEAKTSSYDELTVEQLVALAELAESQDNENSET